MFGWIDAMPIIEKVFFFVALPASIIMLIQTIMLFFGGGGDSGLESDTSGMSPEFDADVAFDAAGDSPDTDFHDFNNVDTGLHFITMRGIITFMTVFGWAGVCLLEMGLAVPAAMVMAVLIGFGAMVGVAFLVRSMMGLQSSGNINYREALGRYADVYLTIPPKGSGVGKVTITLSGAQSQFDAVTDDGGGIKTGEVVRVTDIIRGNVMVVEKERT